MPVDENPLAKHLLPAVRLLALMAGYAVLGISLMITLEVIMRNVFNVSLQGADEYGGYTLAVVASFGFSFALLERAHTRVEIVLERVGTGTQAFLNLFACWCVALMAIFIVWRGYGAMMESIQYKSLSGTPLMTRLWRPQLVWVCGLAFFAICSSCVALHASWLMLRDRARLNIFYGCKSLEDIIEEETFDSYDDPKGGIMIGVYEAGVGFLIMLGLMLAGLPVAVALFGTAFLGAFVYLGWPTLMGFGNQMWSGQNDFLLTAIPLFVFLGEILVRSGVADALYRSLSDWMRRLPGGLLHSNIGVSTIFSAVSGSSVATAATIGTVALPILKERHYDERLTTGTIAAGATLGILIPPSINMIIYGSMTNTSIGQLFAAGLVPGFLLTACFMALIIVLCVLNPGLAGPALPARPLRDKLMSLLDILPPLVIFIVVMGSIYLGWATPTESAAIGVVCSLVVAIAKRRLTFALLHQAMISTVRTSAMILLIMVGALFLNFVVGMLGIPQALTAFVSQFGATPLEIILLLVVFYLVLGCFMETLSMMIATLPVVFPLIAHMGIDPVWFGVFLVLMMEIGLITPPIGMNLYIVQGVRESGSIMDVIRGATPFVLLMLGFVGLLIAWPEMVLWLPNMLF
nr:TRAP transporter large permease subunit [Marinicella sp. W31]MDC2879248.1 TRAP transporter large permease subunit [Marinicella sp. W31]